MLRFNDGIDFDLDSGPMHIVRKRDGLYVVGDGMLIPVDSVEEANQVIDEHNTRHQKVEEKT